MQRARNNADRVNPPLYYYYCKEKVVQLRVTGYRKVDAARLLLRYSWGAAARRRGRVCCFDIRGVVGCRSKRFYNRKK